MHSFVIYNIIGLGRRKFMKKILVNYYAKKLKTMLFPYFMGLSKILGTILGTNIL